MNRQLRTLLGIPTSIQLSAERKKTNEQTRALSGSERNARIGEQSLRVLQLMLGQDERLSTISQVLASLIAREAAVFYEQEAEVEGRELKGIARVKHMGWTHRRAVAMHRYASGEPIGDISANMFSGEEMQTREEIAIAVGSVVTRNVFDYGGLLAEHLVDKIRDTTLGGPKPKPEKQPRSAGSATVDESGWLERAACLSVDPEAFYPEKVGNGNTREAKKVCRNCEVRAECLDYALEHDERFGVWGGLSERERRRLKRAAV